MKLRLLTCCLGFALTLAAEAGIIYSSTSGSIPDGNAVGWSATATASDLYSSMSDLSVTLQFSGGYNGDLYAYLSHGGVLVPLLNRVGVTTGNAFGYGNTGFDITLNSGVGYHDVHFYQNYSPSYNGNGQLTETWQPDGRTLDPLSSPGSFTPSNERVNFGAFNTVNPNGTWTLFIADLSSGAQSQLTGWSLAITEVPEPVNVALLVFGGVFGAVGLARSRQVRNFIRRAMVH